MREAHKNMSQCLKSGSGNKSRVLPASPISQLLGISLFSAAALLIKHLQSRNVLCKEFNLLLLTFKLHYWHPLHGAKDST